MINVKKRTENPLTPDCVRRSKHLDREILSKADAASKRDESNGRSWGSVVNSFDESEGMELMGCKSGRKRSTKTKFGVRMSACTSQAQWVRRSSKKADLTEQVNNMLNVICNFVNRSLLVVKNL